MEPGTSGAVSLTEWLGCVFDAAICVFDSMHCVAGPALVVEDNDSANAYVAALAVMSQELHDQVQTGANRFATQTGALCTPFRNEPDLHCSP